MDALDGAALSRFHLRAALVSGMGFFTDAYDLFVIGIASTLLTQEWPLSSGKLSLLNATMLGAAFLGALIFGRIADLVGRTRVYWLVAAIMVVAALGSAFAPSFWVLIGFRVLLGLGAIPAAAVVYLRRKMPESPRYQAQVQGRSADAERQLAEFSGGTVQGHAGPVTRHRMGLRAFLTNRRFLVMLAGTA